MTDRDRASVSVVIPTFDGGKTLIRCLDRLGARRSGLEVIVVDNGSSDGSVDEVRSRFPQLVVIRNTSNRGYAPACNQGARAATAPFLLFLNDDAVMTPAALDALLAAAAAEEDTAVWQPVTYGEDATMESTGDLFTWWGIFQHLPAVPEGESVPVFASVGAALLVRRSAFEALEGFEDSYFAYYEESDLCWRARMAGWEVRVVTTSRIEHLGSGTTGRLFPPHAVRYLAFRNRIRTIVSNASKRSLVRLVPQHLAACLGFVLIYALTGRVRSAAAVLQAMWWVAGNTDVLREQRTRVQATRRRDDREILRRELVGSFGPSEVWRHLRRAYWFERASERASTSVSDNSRRT